MLLVIRLLLQLVRQRRINAAHPGPADVGLVAGREAARLRLEPLRRQHEKFPEALGRDQIFGVLAEKDAVPDRRRRVNRVHAVAEPSCRSRSSEMSSGRTASDTARANGQRCARLAGERPYDCASIGKTHRAPCAASSDTGRQMKFDLPTKSAT